MPGMMETVLNLGLNDEIVEGLVEKSGDPRFCYDVYRRFVQMYGDVVMGVRPEGIEIDPFEQLIEKKKHKRGVELDNELLAEDLKELVVEFKAEIKKRLKRTFPEDPKEQLWGSIARSSTLGRVNAQYATAKLKAFPTTGARPSTSSPWFTEIWATTAQQAWHLLAILLPAKTSCMANSRQCPGRGCRCRYSHAGGRLPAQAQATQGIQGV